MIVECNSCQTRFQLDDSRIPAQGIRVRCSRCKEAFFLEPPKTASPGSKRDPAHEIAARAAAGGAPLMPDATQDLRAEDAVVEAPPRAGERRRAQAPAAPPAASERELRADDASEEEPEDDWEFSHEVPGASESDDEVTQVQEEASIDERPDASREIEEDAEPLIRGAAEAFADLVEGGAEAENAQTEPPQNLGSGLSLMDEPAPNAQVENAPKRSATNTGAVLDPLVENVAGGAPGADEDNEDWDFFGEDGLDDESADFGGVFAPELGSAEAGSEKADESLAPAIALPDPFESDVESGSVRAAGLAVHAFGWGVVAICASLALFFGLQDPLPQREASISMIGGSSLDLRSVESYWIENVYSGDLFVVSGELRNPGRESAAFERSLAIVLLDAQGRVLDGSARRASVAPGERWLREGSPEQLDQLASDGALELAWTPVAGAESLRFAAWFSRLPDEAARFRVLPEAPRLPDLPARETGVATIPGEGPREGAESASEPIAAQPTPRLDVGGGTSPGS